MFPKNMVKYVKNEVKMGENSKNLISGKIIDLIPPYTINHVFESGM
jgi:hypothetical protein